METTINLVLLIDKLKEHSNNSSSFPPSCKVTPLGVSVDILKAAYALGIAQGEKNEAVKLQKALIESYKKI